MKLALDFDVVNAIKDINEGYTPMKIIRNSGKFIITVGMPTLFVLNYLISGNDMFQNLPKSIVQYFLSLGFN